MNTCLDVTGTHPLVPITDPTRPHVTHHQCAVCTPSALTATERAR